MQRRSLLKLSLVSGVVLALAGGAAVLLQPGLEQGRLSASARELFTSLGRAILQGTLPADAQARSRALAGMVDRMDALVANLPPTVQAELSQLVGLLCTAPGRLGLAGLVPAWADASEAQVQAALESMRFSSLTLRQQAYLALHEMVGGAYFSDESTWASVGYPGPLVL
ncbi:hypothetical protein [Simplicispira suum]|uniref:Twin-arginine translocation pathway signal protein n=1 Tax=Simplicispira suum TaxID=2109915 RepID=A0A2S0N3N8_9BURK|nr:hypothetical protein [Simplicispira suum]AVO42788.1 hypothetical protein C6571_17130 [Simplicispira suum]